MKERTWLGILLSFAAPCRGKMAASVVLAILSVAGGFVPYLGVYQIIRLFLERQTSWEGILFWCGVCLAGYAIKVAGYALSTMLAHVSAYTILEGLRLQAADRLMGAPLGEVDSRPIGAMKSTIVDRIEDIEPPLAHMIPEGAGHVVLPIVSIIALLCIDWRLALASLVTFPLSFICMGLTFKISGKNFEKFDQSSNYMNSTIVEYIEGIEVIKAFGRAGVSYEKYAAAITDFRTFVVKWLTSTFATMKLSFALFPSTLIGTLPVALALANSGRITAPQAALAVMLSISMVGSLILTNGMGIMAAGSQMVLPMVMLSMPEKATISPAVMLSQG